MVLLGVFQRVADQLHPQSLQLDLLDFLFLQAQRKRLIQVLREMPDAFIELANGASHNQLFFE